MNVFRYDGNPIITPADVRASREDFEVIGVFNAAVARCGVEIILLMRVAERPRAVDEQSACAPIYDPNLQQIMLRRFSRDDPSVDVSDRRLIVTGDGTFLTSISHLRVARSLDGVNFQIEPAPAMAPANEYETFGLEDPRITQIDGTYYITYVSVSQYGVTTSLASTKDFRSFERHGVIFHPENKDVVIFPDRIEDRYYALHRPTSPFAGKNEIWIAESDDLICWGNHRRLLELRPGKWDSRRIGAGAVPFELEQGWVEIYHAADADSRYCLGAVLLDAREPWKVLARSDSPLMEPLEPCETEGFFGNVVFTCGLLTEEARVKLYYGAADTSICYAEIALTDIVANLRI